MIELVRRKRFIKKFAALAPDVRARAIKSLRQFVEDPRHPSLHFEKLSTGYHTIRVDLNFRILLRHLGEGRYELADVDSHTAIYRLHGRVR
ncbi:MAG: hypothetical protein P0Y65_04080 [Candidatus Devosia phytovorans]|uniref:Uncharacterized protein n=1 Tax=Candidatus Devosia phytovorans TaxID=3121372 RepID=A0AAJ5VV90_9HYPH|nr:hypothetical protein [Devosia sp.]WEK05444.1 MAG: hypothetical protein P0Y65_04080 [Devosia sp.]